jgi:hypothetical protein
MRVAAWRSRALPNDITLKNGDSLHPSTAGYEVKFTSHGDGRDLRTKNLNKIINLELEIA